MFISHLKFSPVFIAVVVVAHCNGK